MATDPTTPHTASLIVGDRVEVVVGALAHGGHCVARHEGRVLFVRHAVTGERVVAQITGEGAGGRFLRADAVRVLDPAPERVRPPCPWSGPGRCGGCDFQHVDLTAQRALKAGVVVEQFARLAGLDLTDHLGADVVCEPLPGDDGGLRWRTRVEFAVQDGVPGLRRHRSHDLVPVTECLIADPRVGATGVLTRSHPGLRAVDVVAPGSGAAVEVPVPIGRAGPKRASGAPVLAGQTVRQPVELPGGRVDFSVDARGFWQVHPGAAVTFTGTVLGWLGAAPGERALDLYAGVGLFAAGLAQAVGPGGRVLAIEGDRAAVEHGRVNLRPWRQARICRDRVDRAVRGLHRRGERFDVVVLDPPRTGAGRAVVHDVTRLLPRAIGYVACDPAALARDTAYLRDLGYELTRLRVLDAFPMTHHLECLALFVPAQG